MSAPRVSDAEMAALLFEARIERAIALSHRLALDLRDERASLASEREAHAATVADLAKTRAALAVMRAGFVTSDERARRILAALATVVRDDNAFLQEDCGHDLTAAREVLK